jgi:hypothetical protein
MRTFTCLLTDSRYSTPTLRLLLSADAERALVLARRELFADDRHRGFELHEGEQLLGAESR